MPIKHNILLRADGNNEIGLGHVYRCIAIAERIKDYFNTYFAIQNPSKEIVSIISEHSSCLALPPTSNYLQEALQLCTITSNLNLNIVLLDGYHFNTDYQKILKKCNVKLVSIDDDQPFHYVSDVVINHANGIRPEQISKESYTRLFLGYDYLLLRKQFMDAGNKPRKILGIHSALICFGGADQQDITGKLLNCIKEVEYIHNVIVIVGNSYQRVKELKQSAIGYNHIKIKSNLNATEMAAIMSGTDLAIVPASTISLEALISKMILLTGVTASNQKKIYDGLVMEKTVVGIADFLQLTCSEFKKAIKEIPQKCPCFSFDVKPCETDRILEIFKSIT